MRFIKKLFIGPGMENEDFADIYFSENELKNEFEAVWNDELKPSFGIERLLRLFLVLTQCIYPTILIKGFVKRLSYPLQRLTLDLYVLFKFFWLTLLLLTGGYDNLLLVIITIYLLSETVVYILNMIVLADIFSHTVSFSRSMIMLLFNYLQISFCFAIVYLKFELVVGIEEPLAAVYYSLVTMTTLGYGEFYPRSGAGQLVVIIQMIIFSLFIMIFLNYFINKND